MTTDESDQTGEKEPNANASTGLVSPLNSTTQEAAADSNRIRQLSGPRSRLDLASKPMETMVAKAVKSIEVPFDRGPLGFEVADHMDGSVRVSNLIPISGSGWPTYTKQYNDEIRQRNPGVINNEELLVVGMVPVSVSDSNILLQGRRAVEVMAILNRHQRPMRVRFESAARPPISGLSSSNNNTFIGNNSRGGTGAVPFSGPGVSRRVVWS